MLKMFWMLANNLKNLDSAASGLDLGLGRLTKLMGFYRQSFAKLSISKNFDAIPELTNQPGLTKRLEIDHTSGIKQFQVTEVNKGIDRTAQRSKTALWQAPLERHLAAFETGLDAPAGASILTFMPLTRSFSGSGSVAASNTFFAVCRTVRRLQIT
jgi:hypothetical protein